MKYSLSFFLTTIIICIFITFIPVIEGNERSVSAILNITFSECRIWVQDANGKCIAGDKDYHNCDKFFMRFNVSKVGPYWVHAKVQGSLSRQKIQGPFQNSTCLRISGSIYKWRIVKNNLSECASFT
ncbi:9510_t:CDS:1 [Dentiscutata erythropus]|uniref:9510_t:CDS:1 n=1 Tax=Dentiscutata erythropus TaxID=1348616 RepID=A0A9N9HMF0_9GLOM|nr:9510_t:CDS:1 [Dentiscutata erythropus]